VPSLVFDCAIIGGGPAGLTAATYLGRFRRSTIVFDDGESRLMRIPRSRNVPGFPDGVTGPDLLKRMQDQADKFGALRQQGRVGAIRKMDDGFHLLLADGGLAVAQRILIATGVVTVDPDIEHLDEALLCGAIRYCPVCDGFEAKDQAIAVLGGRAASIEEARFLRTYSDRVTYVPAVQDWILKGEEAGIAAREGIDALATWPVGVRLAAGRIRMQLADGGVREFDTVYPCLGLTPRSELLAGMGAEVCPDGGALTDRHQETGVAGVYAAGDVIKGLDQIASACGQAAIAATAMHNSLRQDALSRLSP
jgi:thioredoxin reductase (NADPH)